MGHSICRKATISLCLISLATLLGQGRSEAQSATKDRSSGSTFRKLSPNQQRLGLSYPAMTKRLWGQQVATKMPAGQPQPSPLLAQKNATSAVQTVAVRPSALATLRYSSPSLAPPYFANLPMNSSPALRPTLLPAQPAPAAALPITPAVSPKPTAAAAQPYTDWLNRGLDPCGIKSGRPATEVAACLSKRSAK